MGTSGGESAFDPMGEVGPLALDAVERRLLDEFQHGFPLTSRPFAVIADALGVTEDAVIERLRSLQARGYVTRVGPVVTPNQAGASTLAAMAVPAERLEEVAALVSAHPEVNHNYEREHSFNLWFVVAAPTAAELMRVIAGIEAETGLTVLDLPLLAAYHIDLGFRLAWH